MIKLYWWKEEANFGDAASEYIVSKLFGGVSWCTPQLTIKTEIIRLLRCLKRRQKYSLPIISGYIFPWQKGLFAIGSILDYSNYKTLIWGSGFREYESSFSGGKVYAVRGKLSLSKIPTKAKVGDVALGDPALLLPLIYRPKSEKKYNVSIVPHFVEYDFFKEKYGEKYNIIDVRTNNVESVIDEIVNSKYILSSSLHGLIVAHAYATPALWIKHGWINSSDYKFKDYFSGVGIDLYDGFTDISLILSSNLVLEEYFNKYHHLTKIDNISIIQQKLIESFPSVIINKI